MRDYFQWLAMLDPDSWIIWLKVAFLSGPILLTVASLVLHLYVANRHLGALLEALSNCRYVEHVRVCAIRVGSNASSCFP